MYMYSNTYLPTPIQAAGWLAGGGGWLTGWLLARLLAAWLPATGWLAGWLGVVRSIRLLELNRLTDELSLGLVETLHHRLEEGYALYPLDGGAMAVLMFGVTV